MNNLQSATKKLWRWPRRALGALAAALLLLPALSYVVDTLCAKVKPAYGCIGRASISDAQCVGSLQLI